MIKSTDGVDPHRIRKLTRADIGEWMRVRRLPCPELSAQAIEEDVEQALNDPQTPVFVAGLPGGGLGGFLEVGTRPFAEGRDPRPVGYIEASFVDADQPRKGAERVLVEAAEQWARREGLRELASDTGIHNDVGLMAHRALRYVETERLIHLAKQL
jgi:aminoglycoside 6'-N-acetyltransferase I